MKSCFSRPPKEPFTLTSTPLSTSTDMVLLGSIDRVAVAMLLNRYGMELSLFAR